VVEGTTGPLSATFTVTLSSASTDTIKVNYTTQDGTAKAGTDYTAESGTLTFAPGQTSATIRIPVTHEFLSLPTESFFVELSNPLDTNGGSAPTLGTATAAGKINAATVDISITLAGDGGGTLSWTLNGQNMGSEHIYYDPTLPIQSGSYQAIYRTEAANGSVIEFSDPATAESDFANAEFAQIHAGNTSQNSAGCVAGSELANTTLNKLFSFLAGCQLPSTTKMSRIMYLRIPHISPEILKVILASD
jgi:hypothetical protein